MPELCTIANRRTSVDPQAEQLKAASAGAGTLVGSACACAVPRPSSGVRSECTMLRSSRSVARSRGNRSGPCVLADAISWRTSWLRQRSPSRWRRAFQLLPTKPYGTTVGAWRRVSPRCDNTPRARALRANATRRGRDCCPASAAAAIFPKCGMTSQRGSPISERGSSFGCRYTMRDRSMPSPDVRRDHSFGRFSGS